MAQATNEKMEIIKNIGSMEDRYWKISDTIWSFAELGLEEQRSSSLLMETMEASGFSVTRGVAGMPTAFVAEWRCGTGEPVIGFLAEYDALPMLSQKAGSPGKDPVVEGAPGHGCGHNTMAAMQALTVNALKTYMEQHRINGALKYYGSPAEEMLVSRPFMVREGLFHDVAAVIDCHSWDSFKVQHGMEGLGMYSFTAAFKGITSHSGSTPWLGRSATDAVELMHAGTERMREHLPVSQRTHWVTLEGGEAPNVVPDRARTWYFIRDLDENIEKNFNWAVDCAKGAALMTRTEYEIKVLGACHQRFGNQVLAELIYEYMKTVGKPEYTAEEKNFALALQKQAGFPEIGLDYPIMLETPENALLRGGSSDVGDVTLVAPTSTIRYPARIPGCHSHHWSTTASSFGSFAHKGISAGAKVAALTALDLLTKPELLKKVRDEFEELTKQRPYRSFLPDGTQPPLGWNTALMEKYRKEMEKFYLID
jgi:aminobenzoyl-glutamate utilization protein B